MRAKEFINLMEYINKDVMSLGFSDEQSVLDNKFIIKAETISGSGPDFAGIPLPKFKMLAIEVVDAQNPEKVVATAKFKMHGALWWKNLQARMINVVPDYRRQGIATAVYQYVSKLGNTIKPSNVQLTPGQEMWKGFKRKHSLGEPGVAEGQENFNGIDISMEIQKDDEYVDDEDYDNQVIYVTASSKGKELGHVLFAFDGEYLMPQDLEVEERYRGQGIAQTMYDYVKSKGYKIRRSGQQTDAGTGFWDKHKPGKNVWEQGVAEGTDPDEKYTIKKSYTMSKDGVEKAVWYIMDGDFVVDVTDLRRDAKYYADKWNAAEKESSNASQNPHKPDVAESDLDRFKKYIRPVVKTTPKIEKTTNPAGRTTDHVEWIVTSDTGEKRRFDSKKEAQEFYDLCTKQGVAEGKSNDTAISLSRLGKFHPGADTLAEFVPERATAQYALHPDKWESTFYSLTNKDSDKLKYYGPKKISIPPGTLVGDMAIANKFYRAKTPEEKQQYAEAYKASLQPYPVDVSEYRMPELLIPRQGVAEGLKVDVPNENWLQDKIDYAKRKGRNSHGVPYMGTTTAYTSQNTRVPVDILRQLPGMRGEQQNVRQDDLKAIMKIMKDTGKLPLDRGQEYAPFINVAYNGEAWVNEGNHRIMAAAALGWKDLPVQISYFDGGERVKSGAMYPGKIGLADVKENLFLEDMANRDPVIRTVADFYINDVGSIHKEPLEDYVAQAKDLLSKVEDKSMKAKILDILKQAKKNPYIQGSVITAVGAILAGSVLGSAQKFGLSPTQTNMALQAILNTVIPTMVSRVNGRDWPETLKYTLASVGMGVGSAGMMENFKDGKNPQDKGDSARHGIPKNATISQLKKIRSSDNSSPRKKQLAHWQINMRQGRK